MFGGSFPCSFSSCLGVDAEVPAERSCWEKHGVKRQENGHGACPAHSIPECIPLCQEPSPGRIAAYTLLHACPKDVSPTGFWPPVLLEGAPSLGPQNEDSPWEFTAADPGRERCACVCVHACTHTFHPAFPTFSGCGIPFGWNILG